MEWYDQVLSAPAIEIHHRVRGRLAADFGQLIERLDQVFTPQNRAFRFGQPGAFSFFVEEGCRKVVCEAKKVGADWTRTAVEVERPGALPTFEYPSEQTFSQQLASLSELLSEVVSSGSDLHVQWISFIGKFQIHRDQLPPGLQIYLERTLAATPRTVRAVTSSMIDLVEEGAKSRDEGYHLIQFNRDDRPDNLNINIGIIRSWPEGLPVSGRKAMDTVRDVVDTALSYIARFGGYEGPH